MSCRRAFEIDLLAFLAEPSGPEHAEFRAHYPTCAECAREVAAWTELEASLGAPGGHPEPAALLRFEERAADVAAPERARIEAHLTRCASCRDELRSLRAFSMDDARSVRTRPPPRRSRVARVRSVVLHPVFAYAVVALLAWPAAQNLFSPATRDSVVALQAESAPAAQETALLDELGRREELLAKKSGLAERVTAQSREAAAPAKSRRDAAPTTVASVPAQAEAPRPSSKVEAMEAPAAGASVVAEPARPANLERRLRLPTPAPPRALVLDSAATRGAGFAAERESDDLAKSGPLRIELPPELRAAREVLVRIRDAVGERELRDRVTVTAAESIDVTLPHDWPAGAKLEVELRDAASPSADERVFRQTLTR